ncbi:YqgE/AlgH family protein [Sulfuriroseicoccus oceanibius]|uniref:UPF0301 protein G3M56_010160 n=1 Tax=Sulfuriroseicoccus oceanibius TaxID=2707525 RepID=A0A6B3L1Z2_9BACT|nr:YqgE/AlgH family protein [Sulfuriroseicoccus oceanibius]QQL44256.1 YqgE/AlgH family protein [Sulfuriroseicoccus oceanibius]
MTEKSPLEGQLLVATPVLRDPHFFHSVIYLSDHDDDGAHGLVLNMPVESSVRELLRGQEFDALSDVPVYRGGPVNQDKLTFAKLDWDNSKQSFTFENHLSSTAATEAFQKGEDVRAFVGYSGWTAGQLENELEENAWVTHPPIAAVSFTDATPQLWSTVLRSMGPFYELLTTTPRRPELN